jgi:hypothetical protein
MASAGSHTTKMTLAVGLTARRSSGSSGRRGRLADDHDEGDAAADGGDDEGDGGDERVVTGRSTVRSDGWASPKTRCCRPL